MSSTNAPSTKFKRNPVQVEQAQNLLIPYAKLQDIEIIPLIDAKDRVLAEPVQAPNPFPHFRRSGMDGYAIISQDTLGCSSEHTILLEVIDEIPAGSLPTRKLIPGTAARIMTGAKVPDEADAVVMQEMTVLEEHDGKRFIQLKREISSGTNLTPVGLELQEGDTLIHAGTVVTSGVITVLATFGIHQVPVRRKPRVAICSTGSELLRVEEPIADGKIRNSNSYTLYSQVLDAGGEPFILEAIEDDVDKARERIEQALSEYDIVITTGGVSVGDYDIMADLLEDGHLHMLFNKIAMRPGSVNTAAVRDHKLLFALSGNPGACFVGFELLTRPVIKTMLGASKPFLPKFTAALGHDYKKINNFTRFVRGTVEITDGKAYVYPARLDESSVMITLKDSEVLIVIPPTTQERHAGELVEVIKLPGSQI